MEIPVSPNPQCRKCEGRHCDSSLRPYRVSLHEEPGDKFQLVFDCMAEDADHAADQATDAYPGCEILLAAGRPDCPQDYAIYSPNEAALSGDGAGYWNDVDGWTVQEGATRYSLCGLRGTHLPMSTGQDARCVLLPAPPAGIEVSLDGGVTWLPAPGGVRIVYKDVMIDGEDGRGEVHMNATPEGLITDIWTTRDEPLDHNIGTEAVMIDDIVSRLVGENE